MKVLVTGHKGYIGSRLYKRLEELNHDVTGIDIKEGSDVLHCLPQERFDFIFHMAAMPKVEFSIKNPSYTLKQNVLTTSVLLDWAKNFEAKRVIFSSSAAINGNGSSPASPYGLHKLMSEMECKLYSELYGLETVSLRYFNVYSEDQSYNGSYSTVIASWMEMIKRNLPLRMDGDGYQTRDFIHVDDVVAANISAMTSPKQFTGEAYDIGTGEAVAMKYIKIFVDKYREVEWINAPEREGDVKHSIANIRATKEDLGWSPSVSIVDGLRRCFEVKE